VCETVPVWRLCGGLGASMSSFLSDMADVSTLRGLRSREYTIRVVQCMWRVEWVAIRCISGEFESDCITPSTICAVSMSLDPQLQV
jgi:hypothetical protein